LLLCGAGPIEREFGGFFRQLAGVLRTEYDITLFEGGGTAVSEGKVPSLFGPLQVISRLLPFGGLEIEGAYTEYKRRCLAFGLSLAPALLKGRFDIVHFIDPPMATILPRLRRAFGLSYRLLFTEASSISPPFYPRDTHIHQISPATMQEALIMGIPASMMTLAPCALTLPAFAPTSSRAELRLKHSVDERAFLILANTDVRRIQKRVHYLIDEVSRLDSDALLWINGCPEDPAVADLAARKLGRRCRLTNLPPREVQELYTMADVFVHAAVQEPFGMPIAQALCSGLPVLVHNSAHYGWLTQDPGCLVEMRKPGSLADRLRDAAVTRAQLAQQASEKAPIMRNRLAWETLRPLYLRMYAQLAGGSTVAGEVRPEDRLPHPVSQAAQRIEAGR